MNRPVRFKICGLQLGDNLSFVTSAQVSHVGFIFVPASRRYIEPSVARVMVDETADNCESVGVFANERVDVMREVVALSGVKVVQLHGQEPPEVCEALKADGMKVWKSLSIPDRHVDIDVLRTAIEVYVHCTDALLFDAKPPVTADVTGGHGRTFDWRVLAAIQEIIGDRTDWFVAGGVTPANVAEIVSLCVPTGIDVSSGVETGGRKDIGRIRELLANASTEVVDK